MSTGTNFFSISLKEFLRTAIIAALVSGFWVGLFEALVIIFKVLSNNTMSIQLITQLVLFANIAILLMVGFLGALNILALPIAFPLFRLLWKKFSKLNIHRTIWWLTLFSALVFTFVFWINHNSIRSITSPQSLLENGLALIVAVALSEVFSRIFSRRIFRVSLLLDKKPKSVVFAWSAALAMALFVNLTHADSVQTAKPNVVMLIVDTLRADRLGCYGYPKKTSPAIDKIAERGVLFEQAYVQWASSLPSHASIMTSMYPNYHGAFPNGKSLNPKLLTLAKILKKYGYINGGFVTNTLVGNQYNFALGFDTFTDFTKFDYANTSLSIWTHSLNLVRLWDRITENDIFTELAVDWIGTHKNKPFFLWAQWLHPHAPYDPPEEFLQSFTKNYSGKADGSLSQIMEIRNDEFIMSEEDKRYYEALYDGTVAFSDYQIGRIVDRLEELGLMQNTILIVTSDHGENLYREGMLYGHYGVYDTSLRVPLIFSAPNKLPEQKRLPQVVQSIDIAPTVLDLLQIPNPAQFQGKSLIPLVREDVSDWKSVAYGMMLTDKRNFIALRSDDWKLVWDIRKNRKTEELFHIPTDPGEVENRIARNAQMADSLTNVLNRWIESEFETPDIIHKPGTFFEQDFDEKTVERLRSLGYIK